MAGLNLTSKQKLIGTIAISFSFFVAEIVVAFMTGSLALLADAFHYLNDLIGFVVALAAIIFSFGWARASLLGAFFNGVFLLALGVSIFLQSIERFISLTHIENPELMLIMGCVGLTLNILSAVLLHEHHGHHHHGDSAHHSHAATEFPPPGEIGSSSTEDFETLTPISAHADHRHTVAKFQSSSSDQDLGMLGVLTHVLSDALNNIGVIIAALVVWLTHYDARFYADPGTLGDVKHDLEKVQGIESVHELHVWRLNQTKAVASAHVIVGENDTIADFMERARTVSECLHAYGIHSTTLQPEVAAVAVAGVTSSAATTIVSSSPPPTIRTGHRDEAGCQIVVCGKFCEGLKCCAALTPL
ncbi:cation diffusion facilitator family metal ion transporter [Apiospora arundinis]